MLIDFQLEEAVYLKLIRWLSDAKNSEDVKATLSAKNVHLTLFSSNSNVEYTPIFRNKKFSLTGKFVSGNATEICNLLKSYGAAEIIFDKWADDVDCLLIGSSLEGVNSSIVKSARTSNTAVFEELEFFNKYGLLEP